MNHLSRIVVLCLGVVTLAVPGCNENQKGAQTKAPASKASTKPRESNVADAMRYLPLLLRLDRSMAVKEVVYQLNAWAQGYDSNDKWHQSKLIETLSPIGQGSPIIKSLGEVNFDEADSEYLLQCQMMKQVTGWVLQKDYIDELFAPWVKETGSKLSEDDARKLLDTVKLFDWTVRNIALVGGAKDAEHIQDQPKWPLNDQDYGYRQLPWQTMIYGRGDAWLRARVFTQLLQQVGINSCIIAIEDRDTKEPMIWAIGVPIADQLYIFEPRWGLPLPGSGEQGIATLSQVRSDPTVLRRARLAGNFNYPVTSEDIDRLVLLLDIDPYALKHSTYALEPVLSGDNRMRVWIDADEVAKQFTQFVPATSVRLWEMPLLANHYNEAVRNRLFDQSQFSMQYLATYGAFITDTLMNTARKNHFMGQFQSSSDQDGALKNYMALRVDDATLDRLSYDQDVQRMLSVKRGKSEKIEAFQARAEQVKQYFRVAKFHTTAFLGMAQIDLGNIDAAIDWLDTRTLQMPDTQQWHPHAEYLLARCYEIKGDIPKAIDFLKRENRPQEAGNRIRARMLQSRLEGQKKDQPSPPAQSSEPAK